MYGPPLRAQQRYIGSKKSLSLCLCRTSWSRVRHQMHQEGKGGI